jgi:nicotinate-nucleotide pyrophosphorylase (carboxylating)
VPQRPPRSEWSPLLDLALREDLGAGDVTSEAIFSRDARTSVALEAREALVVCGLDVACATFEALDPDVKFETLCRDGDTLPAGSELAHIHGATRGVLAAERTALNFLQRLCGISSWTARFVAAVAHTGAQIVDTRKTLPGWRVLDKYAVVCGGGVNHRFGLYDGVLIKDNHVAAAGGTALAVKAAREAAAPDLEIQVEVESLADAHAAIEAGADLLLLDNQTVPELREYVTALGKRIRLEATGGVSLSTVREIAETGVHRISIGALTHSAPAVDVALEVRSGDDGRA